MYLIDTNVVSEARKRDKANAGVIEFFKEVADNDVPVYLSAVSIGELRRGVELIGIEVMRLRPNRSNAGLPGFLINTGTTYFPSTSTRPRFGGGCASRTPNMKSINRSPRQH